MFERLVAGFARFLSLDRQALANLMLLAVLLLLFTSVILQWIMPMKTRRAMERAIGVIVILALVLLAKHDEVLFPLAVFVIATLVTETEYLQNLAAIFWDRAWWKQQDAPDAKDNKETAEAAEVLAQQQAKKPAPAPAKMGFDEVQALGHAPAPQNSPQTWTLQEIKKESAQFEAQAIAALAKAGIFPGSSVRPGVAMTSKDGRQLVADAVAENGRTHYVIEASAFLAPTRYASTVAGLRDLVAAYRSALGWEARRTRVRGLLVTRTVPDAPIADLDVTTVICDATGNIQNLDAIRRHLT